MNWLISRFRIFLEVTCVPEIAFARSLSGPSYLAPFVILASLSVLLACLQAPIHMSWLEAQLKATGAPDEQIAANLEGLRQAHQFGVYVIPLLLFARWALFALLLWLAAQLAVSSIEYGATLSVVGYSYLPILLRDAIILLILFLRDKEMLQSSQGLSVAIGLNLLFPKIGQPWASLAGNLNLFELWFVALLVVGIAKISFIGWRRALAIVLPCWLFVLLAQLGFVSLGASIAGQFPGFRP